VFVALYSGRTLDELEHY